MGFTRRFVRRLIIGVVWNTVSLAVMLFLPTGTLHWWRAWVMVGGCWTLLCGDDDRCAISYEERFLRRELAGYNAYAGRGRYRLVPFVW